MARRSLSLAAGLVVSVTVLALASCHQGGSGSSEGEHSSGPRVVLYCATDREIAQDLIDQFEKESGIHVEAKFDTEAAKAVGLVQSIRQEKAHPQCDVFWGGGPYFCTILANDGCLASVPNDLVLAQGTAPHDPLGRWLGFAAAYRVLIVNTDVLAQAHVRIPTAT
jgi:iron(III) transport system substrate-binding protein